MSMKKSLPLVRQKKGQHEIRSYSMLICGTNMSVGMKQTDLHICQATVNRSKDNKTDISRADLIPKKLLLSSFRGMQSANLNAVKNGNWRLLFLPFLEFTSGRGKEEEGCMDLIELSTYGNVRHAQDGGCRIQ